MPTSYPARGDFRPGVPGGGHFGEFERVYPEKYARDFGVGRGVIGDVVGKFLECGDVAHGFARVRCPDCRHEISVLM